MIASDPITNIGWRLKFAPDSAERLRPGVARRAMGDLRVHRTRRRAGIGNSSQSRSATKLLTMLEVSVNMESMDHTNFIFRFHERRGRASSRHGSLRF